jgi:hypothetical protein
MFRKWLFSGLMMLLAAVLVSLVIRGRQQEKKAAAAAKFVEIVKQYKPTAMLVIAPADLEIVQPPGNVLHQGPPKLELFAIRNTGKSAYSNPELDIVYLGRGEKILEKTTRKIDKVISPGQEITIEGATGDAAPEGTIRITLKIRSAEIATEAPDSTRK